MRRLAVAWLLALSMLGSLVEPAGSMEEYRAINGSGNSHLKPDRGAAGTHLMRLAGHAYADLISEPAGPSRPSAREISNEIAQQTRVALNHARGTDYVWLWGQFLDHDIDLSPEMSPKEPFPIQVPAGDPHFDPAGTGTQVIGLDRTAYDPATGHTRNNPRRQMNMITSWIDASNVYGSSRSRADALRLHDGDGLLKTSAGNLLPFNTAGLANAGGSAPSLFLAGDVRANEQVGLTAMHTLWVREHNRLAAEIRARKPRLSGDEIYERARAWVGGLMQSITYNEFLPVLLGRHSLPAYQGWNVQVDGSVAQEFSTAAYRFGHSMVSPLLLRLDSSGAPIAAGHLTLAAAFFAPHEISAHGIDSILRGIAAQQASEIDSMVIDELRNFLFGPPGAGGLDLASLNIQRGRDHGLESFNRTRALFGLRPYREFYEITSDEDLAERLENVYGDVDSIDLWVGGLAEDHVDGALLGPTFYAIVSDQFVRLRDGDRFYYEKMYRGRNLREMKRTTLADVIRRNTGVGGELPDDVFRMRR